jgi:hypothetical protein
MDTILRGFTVPENSLTVDDQAAIEHAPLGSSPAN